MIEVGARRVERSDADGGPVVVLETNEPDPRQLALPMSRPEAHMLAHELRGETTLPGLGHDMLADVMHALGGDLSAVEVTRGADDKPLARLRLESHEGRAVVPARLGLAVALAARLKVPLLLDEVLLDGPAIDVGPSGAADRGASPDPGRRARRRPVRGEDTSARNADGAGNDANGPTAVPDIFLRAFNE